MSNNNSRINKDHRSSLNLNNDLKKEMDTLNSSTNTINLQENIEIFRDKRNTVTRLSSGNFEFKTFTEKLEYTKLSQALFRVYQERLGLYEHEKLRYENFLELFKIFHLLNSYLEDNDIHDDEV